MITYDIKETIEEIYYEDKSGLNATKNKIQKSSEDMKIEYKKYLIKMFKIHYTKHKHHQFNHLFL